MNTIVTKITLTNDYMRLNRITAERITTNQR